VNRESIRVPAHDLFEGRRYRLFGRFERERFERAVRMDASGAKRSLTKWELWSLQTRAGASGDAAVWLDHLWVLTHEAVPGSKCYTTESSGRGLDTPELPRRGS
jgi:hypothetical protein